MSSPRAPKTPDADARVFMAVPNSGPRPSHDLAVRDSSAPRPSEPPPVPSESGPGPMTWVSVLTLSIRLSQLIGEWVRFCGITPPSANVLPVV